MSHTDKDGGWALLDKTQQGYFEKATPLTCLCKITQIWACLMLCGSVWPFLALRSKKSFLLLSEMHPLGLSSAGDPREAALSRQLPAEREAPFTSSWPRDLLPLQGEGLILAQKLHDPVLSVLAVPALENLLQHFPEKGLLICFLLWQQNATQGLLPAAG